MICNGFAEVKFFVWGGIIIITGVGGVETGGVFVKHCIPLHPIVLPEPDTVQSRTMHVITSCYNIMWSRFVITSCDHKNCIPLCAIVFDCTEVVHSRTIAARLFDIVRFCDIRAQACATCVSMRVASHFPYNSPRIARSWTNKTQLKTMVYNDTQLMRDTMQS